VFSFDSQLFLYFFFSLQFRLCFLCGTNWNSKYYVDEPDWSTSLLLPTENNPVPIILPSSLPKLASKRTFKGKDERTQFRLCFLCGTNWNSKYYVDEPDWSTSLLLPIENNPVPIILPSPLSKLASKRTFKGRTSGHNLGYVVCAVRTGTLNIM
jgi:hypothetical protein